MRLFLPYFSFSWDNQLLDSGPAELVQLHPRAATSHAYTGRLRLFAWKVQLEQYSAANSVAEPEPPGAATFRVEPEPIFLLAGAESRSRLF